MTRHELLKKVFGHDEFREGQEKLIDELASGYDVLGVMPTGAGKSICYQIPALMMKGITLVVSPLISLMKDQVMALKASGVAAAYINSSLTPGQQQEAIRRADRGAYKIIYVAPERLEMPSFVAFARRADISLIAVDEAHCVSQWGQDFRPSYLRIAEFVRKLPSRPPVAAFTATATARVREDIIRLLELVEPYQLITGFNRPNLHFRSVKPTSKFAMLQQFLEEQGDECGIVYCNTRKTVETVTAQLCELGYRATRYHAGLSDEERRQNQDAFQFDRARVMVATNAFGMGIDKSNVRFVVHYNMPRNIESYYQEAGRAGRDGQEAECLLLYSGQDVITAKWMMEHSEENPELDEQQRETILKLDLERLKQMTYYATSKTCLRRFILRYFGEADAPEYCGHCSVCENEEFERDTGRSRSSAVRSKRTVSGAHDSLTAWERALFDNLKTLRALIAAENHAPAYTVFSDASLMDMVRRLPDSMDAFLDVSGVGEAKQKQYGEVFLAVIHEGTEPNDAMDDYRQKRRAETARKQTVWTEADRSELRIAYFSGATIADIAKRLRRSESAVRMQMMKQGLISEPID